MVCSTFASRKSLSLSNLTLQLELSSPGNIPVNLSCTHFGIIPYFLLCDNQNCPLYFRYVLTNGLHSCNLTYRLLYSIPQLMMASMLEALVTNLPTCDATFSTIMYLLPQMSLFYTILQDPGICFTSPALVELPKILHTFLN